MAKALIATNTIRTTVALLAISVTACATDSSESTGGSDQGVVRGEGGQPGVTDTSTTGASLEEIDAACAKLSLEECEASDSCFPLVGWPVDPERQCALPELSPISPVLCWGSHNACSDGLGTLRSPEGDCWQMTGCGVLRPGWSGCEFSEYDYCDEAN